MKIRHKLPLGFIGVCLLAISLAVLLNQAITANGFSQYLVSQKQQQFAAAATQHYTSVHGWKGVVTSLRQQGLLPPAQVGSKPDPQPYALADQNGKVLVPAGKFTMGQQLPADLLRQGVAVTVAGKTVGSVVFTGQSLARSDAEDKFLQSVNRSLLLAGLFSTLLAVPLGLWFTRGITQPLTKLTQAAQRLAAGDLTQQVNVATSDELGELASAFNGMSQSLASAQQAQRQMTANIAHDLRNPLTVLGGYVESLQDGTLQATPQRLEVMRFEVEHLRHLVEDLRTLSLADAGEMRLQLQEVAPSELLTQTFEAFSEQARQRGLRLSLHAPNGLPLIRVDVLRMQQVLGNLVSNAFDHTPAGGEISLMASVDEGRSLIEVADTGEGISPEVLPFIFQRSFSGDKQRSGTGSGLGLSIVRSICELHHAVVSVESQVGQGSRFRIRF